MDSNSVYCKDDLNELLNILSERISDLEESISSLESAVDKNKTVQGVIL